MMATTRFQAEIRRLRSFPPNYMFVEMEVANPYECCICMAGPPDSPYSECLYQVRLTIDTSYPINPPQATFATPISHPNVTPAGLVCPHLVAKSWTHQMGIEEFGLILHNILQVPCLKQPYILNYKAAKERGWMRVLMRTRGLI